MDDLKNEVDQTSLVLKIVKNVHNSARTRNTLILSFTLTVDMGKNHKHNNNYYYTCCIHSITLLDTNFIHIILFRLQESDVLHTKSALGNTIHEFRHCVTIRHVLLIMS